MKKRPSNRKMFEAPNRASLILSSEQIDALVLVGWGNRSEGIRTLANFAGKFYSRNFVSFLESCGIRKLKDGTPLKDAGMDQIKELKNLTLINLKGILSARPEGVGDYDLIQYLVWVGEGIVVGEFTPEGVILKKKHYNKDFIMVSPLFYRNKTILGLLG